MKYIFVSLMLLVVGCGTAEKVNKSEHVEVRGHLAVKYGTQYLHHMDCECGWGERYEPNDDEVK